MARTADINVAGDAAVIAIQAGDYATALRKALIAQALLATVPDSTLGNDELRWGRQAIDELIVNLRRQQAAGVGLQQTKISYARATDS
jgi:hypothetical protein